MAKGKATSGNDIAKVILETLEKQGFLPAHIPAYKASGEKPVMDQWREYQLDPANFVRESGNRYSLTDAAREFAKKIGPVVCAVVGVPHTPITRGSRGQREAAKEALKEYATLLGF